MRQACLGTGPALRFHSPARLGQWASRARSGATVCRSVRRGRSRTACARSPSLARRSCVPSRSGPAPVATLETRLEQGVVAIPASCPTRRRFRRRDWPARLRAPQRLSLGRPEGLPAASRPKRAAARSDAGGHSWRGHRSGMPTRSVTWAPSGCSDGQAEEVGHGLELHDGEVAASSARW